MSKLAIWQGDASQIKPNIISQIAFRNKALNIFITTNEKYFISANKGMGKTLLLKLKRKTLHESNKKNHDSSARFIPEGHPFIDSMGQLDGLSKHHQSMLSNFSDAKALWSFALKVSILSGGYFKELNTVEYEGTKQIKEEKNRVDNLQKSLGDTVNRMLMDNISPTQAFRQLVSIDVSKWKQGLLKKDALLEQTIKLFNSHVFVFIDRVDQAILEYDQKIWINLQAGLVEAAWELNGLNEFIRVHASIRQEAFANYSSPTKTNILTCVTDIRYSYDELKKLINKLCQFYENNDCIEKFLQMKEISIYVSKITEDVFGYMFRHTVGRPRDLVLMCSKISEQACQGSPERIRSIVNEIGREQIVPSLFEELSVFLRALTSRANKNKLFSLIRTNILTKAELLCIAAKFSNISMERYSNSISSTQNSSQHPFCELYILGLIGVPQKMNGNRFPIIHFRQPYELTDFEERHLPESDEYFIHPSLQTLIEKCPGHKGYKIIKYVTVGQGKKWGLYQKMIFNLQRDIRDELSLNKRKLASKVLENIVTRMANKNDKEFNLNQFEKDLDWLELRQQIDSDGKKVKFEAFYERVISEGNDLHLNYIDPRQAKRV